MSRKSTSPIFCTRFDRLAAPRVITIVFLPFGGVGGKIFVLYASAIGTYLVPPPPEKTPRGNYYVLSGVRD